MSVFVSSFFILGTGSNLHLRSLIKNISIEWNKDSELREMWQRSRRQHLNTCSLTEQTERTACSCNMWRLFCVPCFFVFLTFLCILSCQLCQITLQLLVVNFFSVQEMHFCLQCTFSFSNLIHHLHKYRHTHNLMPGTPLSSTVCCHKNRETNRESLS